MKIRNVHVHASQTVGDLPYHPDISLGIAQSTPEHLQMGMCPMNLPSQLQMGMRSYICHSKSIEGGEPP